MAHYAFLDENNIVTEVIVGKDEGGLIDWESHYSAFRGQPCKRTSFNTRFGVYFESDTGEIDDDQTKAFRKNFAGIGFTYDPQRDAFIPPKSFASWVLNEFTCTWVPPVPRPDDDKFYKWDEATTSWVEVPTQE